MESARKFFPSTLGALVRMVGIANLSKCAKKRTARLRDVHMTLKLLLAAKQMVQLDLENAEYSNSVDIKEIYLLKKNDSIKI